MFISPDIEESLPRHNDTLCCFLYFVTCLCVCIVNYFWLFLCVRVCMCVHIFVVVVVVCLCGWVCVTLRDLEGRYVFFICFPLLEMTVI